MQNIHNIIGKFANSFDLKDWSGLASILANPVVCDYRDLRGTIDTFTPEAYVAKRIEALQLLKTQHLFSNLEIESREDYYWCRANAMIIRKTDDAIFHTHAIYEFVIKEAQGVYKIHQIKQIVLWNEGNASIHSGAKK